VHREFLDAAIQFDQPEMAGADVATAGANDQLAAAAQQRRSHVIDIGPERAARSADADMVRRIGAVAAGPVRAEQVIPAVTVHHRGGFHVDRDVDRLVARNTQARLGIEFDNADRPEIGAVGQP
jgi:hypothetical protein